MKYLTPIVHWVSWHRRLVGSALAGFAVVLLGSSLSPPDAPTQPAAVVAAPLPAGHTLAPADVRLAQLPPELVPVGALTDAELLVGRSTAVAMERGTVVQPSLLASNTAAEPGRALVPIALRDESLRSLLKPGDAITLVSASYEEAEVLTSDARVAVLPTPSGGSALDLGGGSQGSLILVDVPAAQAPLIAVLGQDGGLRVILGQL